MNNGTVSTGNIGAFLPLQTIALPTVATYRGGANFGNISINPTGQVMVSFQDTGTGVGPGSIWTAEQVWNRRAAGNGYNLIGRHDNYGSRHELPNSGRCREFDR